MIGKHVVFPKVVRGLLFPPMYPLIVIVGSGRVMIGSGHDRVGSWSGRSGREGKLPGRATWESERESEWESKWESEWESEWGSEWADLGGSRATLNGEWESN